MRRTATTAVALTACAVLSAVAAAPAQAAGVDTALTTKTPYRPQQSPRDYQRPPAGYSPVFTENASRHGSRALSDGEDGDLLLALWRQAQAEGALTPAGRRLGPDVQALLDANARVGYGQLTGRGKREIRDTAVRMERRLPGLFDGIAASGGAERIDVVSSGQQRATDSGAAFTGGLVAAEPGLAPAVGATRTDTGLLYFHKAPANKDYRDYVDHDPRLAATLTAIRGQERTHRVSRRVLERLFGRPFVDRVAAGAYRGLGVTDEVAAAEALYSLWSITPSLADEGDWHFGRYLGADDAAWFGYLDDAEEFYSKGPGFAGDDITYRMAGVLLDDFFAKAEAKRAGTSDLGAELRFTHAEEIIPLAALMQLPDSTRQADPAKPYTYADNPWRGATVAPMGANIQWDLFRKDDKFLVRMVYNERQTAFKPGCRPVSEGSYFYDLNELERCFGRTTAQPAG
ncbi:histidine-type phosphatase [Kitasatospora sp. NPDC048540]|uniref:histidine-type phosphatase n=1 Tax=unclassified Kitasatospora TaxID=2633591 RepID=UPI000539B065|nr:histidine-type phosphatase [Kitasatospora sp. MBT63]